MQVSLFWWLISVDWFLMLFGRILQMRQEPLAGDHSQKAVLLFGQTDSIAYPVICTCGVLLQRLCEYLEMFWRNYYATEMNKNVLITVLLGKDLNLHMFGSTLWKALSERRKYFLKKKKHLKISLLNGKPETHKARGECVHLISWKWQVIVYILCIDRQKSDKNCSLSRLQDYHDPSCKDS